jgi:hypothetical protein
MTDEPGRDRKRHIYRAGDRSREATGADRCTRRPPAAAAAIRRESSVARAESPPARAQSVGALPRVHRAAPASSPTRPRRPPTRLPGLGGPERRRRLTPANSGRVGSPQPTPRPARAPGPRRANTGHSARATTCRRMREARHAGASPGFSGRGPADRSSPTWSVLWSGARSPQTRYRCGPTVSPGAASCSSIQSSAAAGSKPRARPISAERSRRALA